MSDETGKSSILDWRMEAFDGPWPPSEPLPAPAPPSRTLSVIAAVTAVATLLYLCSPIDLLPEAGIPFIGFLDDLLVLFGGLSLVVILTLVNYAQNRKYRQHVRRQEEMGRLIDQRVEQALNQRLWHSSPGTARPILPPSAGAQDSTTLRE